MFYGCIYGLRSPSGKWYIGQTTNEDPFFYINKHYKYQYGGNRSKLSNALKKYSFDLFEVKVFVYLFDKESLDKAEVAFIDSYDSINHGYNCREGGSRGKNSTETIKKMRISQKERPRSEREKEWAVQLGLSNLNRVRSENEKEHIVNLGKSWKGKTRSEETKLRMSKSGEMYLYEIEGPDNCIYEITNLVEFSRMKNIQPVNIRNYGHTKGYTLISKVAL